MTLDRLVTLRRNTPTWSAGVASDVWADAGTFWAKVEQRTGREAIRAGTVEGSQPVVVTGRYVDTSSATTDDRLRLPDGSDLVITSVREVGRRHWNEFVCVAQTDV